MSRRHAVVRFLVCFPLVVLYFAVPVAQSTEISFDGQVRVRAEGADRSQRAQEVIWDIFQRTRLGLRADVSDEVDLYVQIQDSRTYGSESSTLSSSFNVDLHQGWAEIHKPWGEAKTGVRVGRQELAYGSERIIGAVGWSNIGRAFDGARARMARGGWTFDLGAFRLTEDVPTADASDDFFVTYNGYAFPDHDVRAEFYAMYRDDDRGFYETTLGEHAAGRIGPIRFDHEFAVQLGSRPGADVEAFLFSTQAHARVGARAELGAGIDWVSGDDDTSDGTFRYFDLGRLFHTGHKFYGLMDSALALAGPAGLLDPYGRIGVRGPRELRADLTVHVFYTHRDFTLPAVVTPPSDSRYLGTEIDARVGLAVASRTRFELGGAVLVPGQLLEDRGLDRTAVWAYAQGIASF